MMSVNQELEEDDDVCHCRSHCVAMATDGAAIQGEEGEGREYVVPARELCNAASATEGVAARKHTC